MQVLLIRSRAFFVRWGTYIEGKRLKRLVFIIWLVASFAHAEKGQKTLTAQAGAFTANAGGQEALALRIGDDYHDLTLFKNNYLVIGDESLYGVIYDWRFPICASDCWIPMYYQAGIGLTNATPLVELGWSINPLGIIRVDFMTHLFLNVGHVASWSYPIWTGISIPL